MTEKLFKNSESKDDKPKRGRPPTGTKSDLININLQMPKAVVEKMDAYVKLSKYKSRRQLVEYLLEQEIPDSRLINMQAAEVLSEAAAKLVDKKGVGEKSLEEVQALVKTLGL